MIGVIPGSRFGRWEVVGPDETNKKMVICMCGCGTQKAVHCSHLKYGKSRSCGCLRREVHTKHGCDRKSGRTAEYSIWMGMLRRVRGTGGTDAVRLYSDRGITVCERWLKFENFLADMGLRPSPKHSIDRINNDGNYEPGNCRWATATQQNLNRRSSGRNTSGVMGVCWDKGTGRWRALFLNKHLGRFVNKHEAHVAYRAARRKWEEDQAKDCAFMAAVAPGRECA